jgi:hypothetical protein
MINEYTNLGALIVIYKDYNFTANYFKNEEDGLFYPYTLIIHSFSL